MNFNNTGILWNPSDPTWGSNAHFLPYIARLTTSGDLDTTFGVGGFNQVDWPGLYHLDVEATDIKILADDSILVSFIYFQSPPGGPVVGSANGVMRFTKDGILDSTFGTNGLTIINRSGGGYSDVSKVDVQSDGKIILSGCDVAPQFYTVAYQLKSDGTPVPNNSFGNQGTYEFFLYASQDAHLQSLLIQPDDKIVLGFAFGPYGGHQYLGVARLNADGTADTNWGSFSSGGQQPTNITVVDLPAQSYANVYGGLLMEPITGNIIVTGFGAEVSDTAIVLCRLNAADGSLDTSFGQSSGITLQHGGPNTYDGCFSDAAFYDNSGKIVIGGSSGTPGIFFSFFHQPTFTNLIAKYTASGIPDSAFNTTGFKSLDVDGTNQQICYGGFGQADGKYVFSGHGHGADYPTGGALCWIARTDTSGVLDTSFGMDFNYNSTGPEVAHNGTSNTGATSVTVRATINPNGDSTSWCFQYGTVSGQYTEQTSTDTGLTGSSPLSVSKDITGLSTLINYYGRAVGWSKLGGVTIGNEVSFTPGAQSIRNRMALGIGLGLTMN
jgi:uncharacterized delta-60 repeat protein